MKGHPPLSESANSVSSFPLLMAETTQDTYFSKVGLKWILLLYGVFEETRTVITSLIWLHNGIGIFMWPASFTLPNMLRACNDVKFTMIVSICSMFVLRIGFSNILGVYFEMGIVGVWTAMILDWICRISFFVPRYLSGKWEKRCRII